MKNQATPQELLDELPYDIDVSKCTVTTCANADIDTGYNDVADDAVVVISPVWTADDGNADVDIIGAKSDYDAAQEYVFGGEWGEITSTVWFSIATWNRAWAIDADGDVVELRANNSGHTIEMNPPEPECERGHEHDWQAPYQVLGGLEENPGVWGHGGGVIIREVCSHCGKYRIRDTWAQNPENGMQGLESVEYEDADDASEEWIEQMGENDDA